MNMTADDVYGPLNSIQPNELGPTHPVGHPEPFARTKPNDAQRGPLENPTFMLVLLVALGLGIVHVSVKVGK